MATGGKRRALAGQQTLTTGQKGARRRKKPRKFLKTSLSIALVGSVTAVAIFSLQKPTLEATMLKAEPAQVTPKAAPIAYAPAVVVEEKMLPATTAFIYESPLRTPIDPWALGAYEKATTIINEAAPSCNLPWQMLAAIAKVKSNHGKAANHTYSLAGAHEPALKNLTPLESIPSGSDTDKGKWDGKKGRDVPMGAFQMFPATWTLIAVDGNSDGKRSLQQIEDTSLAASVYLCSLKYNYESSTAVLAGLQAYSPGSEFVAEASKAYTYYTSKAFEKTMEPPPIALEATALEPEPLEPPVVEEPPATPPPASPPKTCPPGEALGSGGQQCFKIPAPPKKPPKDDIDIVEE